jgi:hypothetical protein
MADLLAWKKRITNQPFWEPEPRKAQPALGCEKSDNDEVRGAKKTCL